MATVYFYEKPGCANNTKQKKLLTDAGHRVVAIDLLTETWQPERLQAFFGDLPLRNWFNYSAPPLKYGEIDPNKLSGPEALMLMVQNPLLIRRPLMQVGDSMMAGFDRQAVDNWIGLQKIDTDKDLESCPRSATQTRCGHD